MVWAAVAGVATAAIGAGTAVYSARQARSLANQSSALADPFAGSRDAFAQKLMDDWDKLTSLDPNEILKDPSFQFLQEQGMGGINAGMAASGKFNSGNRAIEGAKFSSGLSSQFMDKRFQQQQQILAMLGQFSGATTGSPGAAGQLYGQGQSASLNYLNQGVGNTLSLLNRVPWSGVNTGGGVNAAAGTALVNNGNYNPNTGWGG